MAKLDIMGQAMNDTIAFPAMRGDVEDAIQALADPNIQDRWGMYDADRNYYDDLTMNLNILFDCRVFPNPWAAIDAVISAREAEPLAELWTTFQPLLLDLGDRPDLDYLTDPRWPKVVAAASRALIIMRQFDEEMPNHIQRGGGN